jgi:hypothetical protein
MWILQNQRALHVSGTMKSAGKLKMTMANGSGGLKDAQNFFP